MVWETVVRAKEDKVAAEGEGAGKDGQVRWGSIHRLQRAHSGSRPVKAAADLKKLVVN